MAQHLLLDTVEAFTELHPQVTIDILASDRLSQLVDDRVDVALRFTQQPDESLIARRLIQVDTVVCASPQYLQTHDPIIEPADLSRHNCFVHLTNHTWDLVRDNQHFSVRVSGTVRANDMEILRSAALHHKGVVWLPCDLANPCLRRGELVKVLADYHSPSSHLWAVYLSRSYQTPLVRQFIDFVAERWQDDIRVPI